MSTFYLELGPGASSGATIVPRWHSLSSIYPTVQYIHQVTQDCRRLDAAPYTASIHGSRPELCPAPPTRTTSDGFLPEATMPLCHTYATIKTKADTHPKMIV